MKIKRICGNCRKEFRAFPCRSNRKYCSAKCYHEYDKKHGLNAGKNNPMYGRYGENNPYWKGGEVTRYCIMCGKKMKIPKCRVERGQGLFCSYKCRAQWRSENKSGENSHMYGKYGENHPSWRGGKSFEPYSIEFNKKLKSQIRKRDNYTCQECGFTEKQSGRKLDLHHINYCKLDNRPENLILLCRSCHSQTNYKREDWTKYFQGILNKEEFDETQICG